MLTVSFVGGLGAGAGEPLLQVRGRPLGPLELVSPRAAVAGRYEGFPGQRLPGDGAGWVGRNLAAVTVGTATLLKGIAA
jgi:hypothetical protein